MPVASLSDSHSADAEAFSPPREAFIHLPIGWEASSALNHGQRIWWGRFHRCMRFCWHEDFLVLANTEGDFVLLGKHQTTSASF